MPVPKGQQCVFSKLAENEVREIRQKYANKQGTMRSLADEYDITHVSVSNIIHRRNWKHVD
jgi:hypothetical protein